MKKAHEINVRAGLKILILLMADFVFRWPTSACAVWVEQAQDLYLHSGTVGSSGTSTVWRLGRDYAQGDGVMLFAWDNADLAAAGSANNVFLTLIEKELVPSNGDGSFSIHQMLVPWNETSTLADFGGGLPQAGEHYQIEPVAAGGFNKEDAGLLGLPGGGQDDIDLGKLVQYWSANPSKNLGIIFVSRPQYNMSYPVAFDRELMGHSRESTPGTTTLSDQRLDITSTGSLPPGNLLKPIEDSAIFEDAPDDMKRRNFTNTSLYAAPGQKHISLYKFGFGDLFLEGEDSLDFDFSSARMKFNTGGSGNSGEIQVTVHKMLTAWDEATVTWNQFGTSGPQPGTDYDQDALAIFNLLGGRSIIVIIDLTVVANEWLDDPENNHGILMIPTSVVPLGDNIAPLSSEFNLGHFEAFLDTYLSVALRPDPDSNTLPTLRFERSPTQWVLHWPLPFGNFSVETTDSLLPDDSWIHSAAIPQIGITEWSVSLPLTGTVRLYRLVSDGP